MILSYPVIFLSIESSRWWRRKEWMNTSEVSHIISFLYLLLLLLLHRLPHFLFSLLITSNQWCNRLEGFFFYYYICTSSNFFTCLPQVSFSLFLHWFESIYIKHLSSFFFSPPLLLQLFYTRILYHVPLSSTSQFKVRSGLFLPCVYRQICVFEQSFSPENERTNERMKEKKIAHGDDRNRSIQWMVEQEIVECSVLKKKMVVLSYLTRQRTVRTDVQGFCMHKHA